MFIIITGFIIREGFHYFIGIALNYFEYYLLDFITVHSFSFGFTEFTIGFKVDFKFTVIIIAIAIKAIITIIVVIIIIVIRKVNFIKICYYSSNLT